jgi:hypothetical protein
VATADSLAYVPEPVDPPPQVVSGRNPTVTRRPAPPALEADTPRLVIAGIALWAVAFVVALVVDRDADVLWTCVAGAVLGALGYVLAVRARSPRPRPPAGDRPAG